MVFLTVVFCAANIYAEDCQVLKVSGSMGWNPLIIKNTETDQISGMGYDLAQEIGTRLKIPIKFIELPWKRVLHYLEQGELDIVLGIYWTQQRSKDYLYSSSIFQNEARVFVHKDKQFAFESLEDLIGKKGDIPLGASFGDEFDQFAEKKLEIENVGVKKSAFKRLLTFRSDYYVSDYFDVMWELRKQGLNDKIVPLPRAVSNTRVYVAVSRKSPCSYLAAEFTNLIEIFKHDGTMDSIIGRYVAE